jgi:hypothetical protein
MSRSISGLFPKAAKKSLSVLATASLTLIGLTAISTPAAAGTNVDVFYAGNTIGTAVPQASQSIVI